MKNCIYIGKSVKRVFNSPVWIEGIGTLTEVELSFGITGYAFYFRDKRKWDFRPDGLNIYFYVKGKDLYFEGEEDKYTYPVY